MEASKHKDLLQGNLAPKNVKASIGKRLGNYIIDLASFCIIILLIEVTWAVLSPASIGNINDDTSGFNLLDILIILFAYGLVMGVIEGITKGKSLGKLITGTRAVNEDGSTISFQTAMFRGLCRAVPFNQLSALGSPSYPWHDKWTNTEVIDEKESGYNSIKN
jgi:uncharacterized RDD family membrane protein YckC